LTKGEEKKKHTLGRGDMFCKSGAKNGGGSTEKELKEKTDGRKP